MEYTECLKALEFWVEQFCKEIGDETQRIEYYFLGLLNLANAEGRCTDSEQQEQDQLKHNLKLECLSDLAETEAKLRERISHAVQFDSFTDASRYLNIAKKYAVESFEDDVNTLHLLGAILFDPTNCIEQFLKEREDTLIVPKKDVEEILRRLEEEI